MRVFISWSGSLSKQVAEALRDWLPTVIQAVKPWVSAADIEKGETWFTSIQSSLTDAKGMGIFCLTPDNLVAPWLAFEAGALASQDRGRVATFLFNVDADAMKPPLSLFQATNGHDKSDVLKLLESINSRLAEPLPDQLLNRVFDTNWGSLDASFKRIHAGHKGETQIAPKPNEMIQEILNTVRRLEKDQQDLTLLAQSVEASRRRSANSQNMLDLLRAQTAGSHHLESQGGGLINSSVTKRRVDGHSIPDAKDDRE